MAREVSDAVRQRAAPERSERAVHARQSVSPDPVATGRTATDPARPDLATIEELQRRVLWLSTRIIDAANRERPNADGIKIGGHQASSASSATIMCALWFHHLTADDRVAVKPHAAPVLHAIEYLLGNLDRSYLTRLRSFGGLQPYPSRTKDPIRVDFSTGSVGLGAAAPLFAATVRRYVDAHFPPRPSARFFALIGDAELDEGNVWEAIADPSTAGLGNVRWVVDFNRQSLDRVVPGVRIHQWRAQFEAAGWNVIEVKYGRRLAKVLERSDSAAFAAWFDEISNEQYQSLFTVPTEHFRTRFLDGAPEAVTHFCAQFDDDELVRIVTDLGGHDLHEVIRAFECADGVTDRPTVLFCYTVKGWSLPIAGDPRNHSAQLSGEQIDDLRLALGVPSDDEWARFDPASETGRLAEARARALGKVQRTPAPPLHAVPESVGAVQSSRGVGTQEVFGRTVTALARDPGIAPLLVSTAPDVATTTNLAGFVNRAGSFSPEARDAWNGDDLTGWREGPAGQHIELGISEMNFFTLLGQLGLAWDLSDQPLLAIGTVYDPFVLRGLDALLNALYSGSRFVLAGTPSGTTLAPEGGAHQSTVTVSLGLELPELVLIEPCYARAVEWLLCDALGRIARNPSGLLPASAEDEPRSAYYFRLSTRPVDQQPFDDARTRLGDRLLREQVLAGAYRLREASSDGRRPEVNLVGSGTVLPEVLDAALLLEAEGVAAHVIDVTSPSRLFVAWQRSIRMSVRTSTVRDRPGALHAPFVAGRPLVTVNDASSHAAAWLGSALGVPALSLGVDAFGQAGTIGDLRREHAIDADSIATAALSVLAG